MEAELEKERWENASSSGHKVTATFRETAGKESVAAEK
jgi:hypothetical protein